jgi:hypothetical protein
MRCLFAVGLVLEGTEEYQRLSLRKQEILSAPRIERHSLSILAGSE